MNGTPLQCTITVLYMFSYRVFPRYSLFFSYFKNMHSKSVHDDEMVTIVRCLGCLLTWCWFLCTCKTEICHQCEPALALVVSLYNQFPLLLCVISQMHILRLHKTLCTCTYNTDTWSL